MILMLWKGDPFLWAPAKDVAGQHEVTIRMGWLDSTDKARKLLKSYQAFAKEVKKAKIDRSCVGVRYGWLFANSRSV